MTFVETANYLATLYPPKLGTILISDQDEMPTRHNYEIQAISIFDIVFLEAFLR